MIWRLKNHPKNVENVLVINYIVYLNLKKAQQGSLNSGYMQKWIKKPTVSADLSHSARLDAKRLNRWKGERWCWNCPFS